MHSDTQPGFYLPNSQQRAPDYFRRPQAESAGLWSQGYLLNHVTGITIQPVLNKFFISNQWLIEDTLALARAAVRAVANVALGSPGRGESAWIESAGVDQPAAGLNDDSLVVGQGLDQFKTALPAEHKYTRR